MEFDAVITAVGGGGLYCGIVQGLQRHGLHEVPVVAVETVGADSLSQSIHAGEAITLPAITSIATSLGARRVADEALRLAKSHPTISLTLSDKDATQACVRFADAMRVMVEPACGAALAALSVHEATLARFKRPLIEVCGGIAVSMASLAAWTIPA